MDCSIFLLLFLMSVGKTRSMMDRTNLDKKKSRRNFLSTLVIKRATVITSWKNSVFWLEFIFNNIAQYIFSFKLRLKM